MLDIRSFMLATVPQIEQYALRYQIDLKNLCAEYLQDDNNAGENIPFFERLLDQRDMPEYISYFNEHYKNKDINSCPAKEAFLYAYLYAQIYPFKHEEILEHITIAERKGSHEAVSFMCYFLYEFYKPTSSLEKAASYFQQAKEKGNSYGWLYTGLLEDVNINNLCINIAAEKGNASALCVLATLAIPLIGRKLDNAASTSSSEPQLQKSHAEISEMSNIESKAWKYAELGLQNNNFQALELLGDLHLFKKMDLPSALKYYVAYCSLSRNLLSTPSMFSSVTKKIGFICQHEEDPNKLAGYCRLMTSANFFLAQWAEKIIWEGGFKKHPNNFFVCYQAGLAIKDDQKRSEILTAFNQLLLEKDNWETYLQLLANEAEPEKSLALADVQFQPRLANALRSPLADNIKQTLWGNSRPLDRSTITDGIEDKHEARNQLNPIERVRKLF